MTISDVTKGPEGLDELPPWLRVRYRSRRHIEALIGIGRVMRDVGMTWQSLHRALEPPGEMMGSVEVGSANLLAMVDKLERVRPWPLYSSAPEFVRSLRGMASRDQIVELSPRQAMWLKTLLRRAEQIERATPVETAMRQPNEVETNVVPFRTQARGL